MIARARLLLVVAFVAGIVIVATEFPLGQLIRGRAAMAQASAQLTRLQAQNRALAAQVASLHEDATIARIAHEEYGLISKGERSIVVLPAPSRRAGTGTGPLNSTTVPRSDLVPTDAIVSPTGAGGSKPVKQAGYWARLLQRLEFWKAVP
ncbi:MAG: septum formation initiator family protein [Acidimicrobiales bacterium]